MADNINGDKEKTESMIIAAYKLEYYIILTLMVIIGVVTLFAMTRLLVGLYFSIFTIGDLQNPNPIQILFGMIMTVLISLEFGNSILRHIYENSTIIQAREIILIGMMAVVRKVIILDLSVASAWQIAALGAVALSLAGAYWLMKND